MSAISPGKPTPAERAFEALCRAATLLPLLVLAGLLLGVLAQGIPELDLDFLSGYPSRRPERAGILPAACGSLAVIALTGLLAIPIGAGAAIYLEEYDRESRLARLVEVNIANLAGVPSVIYGLLGLEVFVRVVGLGRSLLAGAATLALLVLPIVIMASREALRAVPRELREGSLALGASRWQTVLQVVLPMAAPGILTGAILATSRALGETAPLVVVGALTYTTILPTGLDSSFTVLPIQIFNWVSRPQHAFRVDAAAGIVVLLLVMTGMNAIAVLLRDRFERRWAR